MLQYCLILSFHYLCIVWYILEDRYVAVLPDTLVPLSLYCLIHTGRQLCCSIAWHSRSIISVLSDTYWKTDMLQYLPDTLVPLSLDCLINTWRQICCSIAWYSRSIISLLSDTYWKTDMLQYCLILSFHYLSIVWYVLEDRYVAVLPDTLVPLSLYCLIHTGRQICCSICLILSFHYLWIVWYILEDRYVAVLPDTLVPLSQYCLIRTRRQICSSIAWHSRSIISVLSDTYWKDRYVPVLPDTLVPIISVLSDTYWKTDIFQYCLTLSFHYLCIVWYILEERYVAVLPGYSRSIISVLSDTYWKTDMLQYCLILSFHYLCIVWYVLEDRYVAVLPDTLVPLSLYCLIHTVRTDMLQYCLILSFHYLCIVWYILEDRYVAVLPDTLVPLSLYCLIHTGRQICCSIAWYSRSIISVLSDTYWKTDMLQYCLTLSFHYLCIVWYVLEDRYVAVLPDTLVPLSLYCLIRTGRQICCSIAWYSGSIISVLSDTYWKTDMLQYRLILSFHYLCIVWYILWDRYVAVLPDTLVPLSLYCLIRTGRQKCCSIAWYSRSIISVLSDTYCETDMLQYCLTLSFHYLCIVWYILEDRHVAVFAWHSRSIISVLSGTYWKTDMLQYCLTLSFHYLCIVWYILEDRYVAVLPDTLVPLSLYCLIHTGRQICCSIAWYSRSIISVLSDTY